MEQKQRRLLMVLAMTVAIGVAASTANAQLIAYWPLDESVGSIAKEMVHGYDIDGINLDGRFSGLPTWDDDGGRIINGAQSGAIYLHGGLDAIQVPQADQDYNPILDFLRQPMTLAFWAKTDGTGWGHSYAHMVSKGYSYRVYANGTSLNCRWRTNYGYIMNCESSVANGEWHHFAGTYDGARNFKFYVDGVLENERNNTRDAGPYDTSYWFTIGCNYYYTSYGSMAGWIDDVSVWGIELSPDQIDDLMDKGALGVNIPPVVDAGPPQIGHIPFGFGKYAEIRLNGAVDDQTVFGANVLNWQWGVDEFGSDIFFFQTDGVTPQAAFQPSLDGVAKAYVPHIFEVVLSASDGVLEANDIFLLDVRNAGWSGELIRYSFEETYYDEETHQYLPGRLKDTGSASEEDNDLLARRYIGILDQPDNADHGSPYYTPLGVHLLTFEPGINMGDNRVDAIHLRDVNLDNPVVDYLEQPQPTRVGTELQTPTTFETALHGFGTYTIEAYIKPDPGIVTLARLAHISQVDYDKGWDTTSEDDDANVDMWYLVIDINPYQFGMYHFQSNGNIVSYRYGANDGYDELLTPANEWSHVALTADAFYVTLWCNGFEVRSFPYDGTVKIDLESDDGLRISSIFYNRSYVGLLDEFAVNLEAKDAAYMQTQAKRLPIALKFPENGYQYASTDTLLKWAPGKGPFAFDYEVWLDDNKVATITDGSTTYAPDSLLPDTEYKWQIRPIVDGTPNAAGNSEEFTFRTLPGGFEGMIGHWAFDEGSGRIANDTATGLNRKGVDWNYVGQFKGDGDPDFVGGWVPDGAQRKFAGNFSGEADNYVLIVEPNVLAEVGAPDYIAGAGNSDPCIFRELPYNSYTLSLWMKTPVGFQAIDETFLSFGQSYNLRRYWYSDYATFMCGGIRTVDGGQYVVGDGNWHHIAGVYDKMNGVVSLYVDGQLDSSEEFDYLNDSYLITNSDIDRSVNSELRIASNYIYTGRNFNGSIDDVRIYSHVALDAAGIQALYNMGYAHKVPSVDAGDNQVITGASTSLSGIVNNDFLPPAAASTVTWSQVSGPSTATITPTNNANTTVSDLVCGVYTFRLTVNDGSYDPYDEVKVWVQSAADDAQQLLYFRFEEDIFADTEEDIILEVANEMAFGNNYIATPDSSVTSNPLLEDANYVAMLDPNVPVSPLPLTAETNLFSLSGGLDDVQMEGAAEIYPELQFAENITVEFFAEIANEGTIDLINFLGQTAINEDRTIGSGFRFYNPRALRVQYYIEGDAPGRTQRIEIRTTANLSDYTTGSGVNVEYHVQGWKHVAWTYDKATGTSRVFENGVPVYITHVTEMLPSGDSVIARPGEFYYDGIDGRGLVMPPMLTLDDDPEAEEIIFMRDVNATNPAYFDEVRISAKVLPPSQFLIVGENHCLGVLAADIDGNCQVDLYDYVILALNWMKNSGN